MWNNGWLMWNILVNHGEWWMMDFASPNPKMLNAVIQTLQVNCLGGSTACLVRNCCSVLCHPRWYLWWLKADITTAPKRHLFFSLFSGNRQSSTNSSLLHQQDDGFLSQYYQPSLLATMLGEPLLTNHPWLISFVLYDCWSFTPTANHDQPSMHHSSGLFSTH